MTVADCSRDPQGFSDAETVSLDDLVMLHDMQPRKGGTERATVERYRAAMAAGSQFPPIILARMNDALVLVDGWHRVAAMRLLGIRTTPAVIREGASPEEAILWAFEENRKHGLPLKKGALLDMFVAYVKAGRCRASGRRRKLYKRYEDMAAELGIPSSTLQRWMVQKFPSIAGAIRSKVSPGRGGPRSSSQTRLLSREAWAALNRASAAIKGITDGMDRYHLLLKTQEIVAELNTGELIDPGF